MQEISEEELRNLQIICSNTEANDTPLHRLIADVAIEDFLEELTKHDYKIVGGGGIMISGKTLHGPIDGVDIFMAIIAAIFAIASFYFMAENAQLTKQVATLQNEIGARNWAKDIMATGCRNEVNP